MPDRTIVWGDPADAGTKYRTQDDDPAGGGNFVVAEDTDGNTVLLQWNPDAGTAGQWEYSGPVDLGGNDLTSVGTATVDAPEAGDTRTETIGSGQYLYAGDFDGGDADDRLDNALASASEGTTIYLERADYGSDRTIPTPSLTIVGVGVQDSISGVSSRIQDASWTVSGSRCYIKNVGVSNGTIKFDATSEGHRLFLRGSSELIVNSDEVLLSHIGRNGSITFNSGTSAGEIGIVSGNVTITDNGSNSIL